MKISFTPLNIHKCNPNFNNRIKFGARDNQYNDYYSTQEDKIQSINHDYDVQLRYLTGLAADLDLSPQEYMKQANKIQVNREKMLAAITDDNDILDDEDADFLETISY